jgi:hypothetical protein
VGKSHLVVVAVQEAPPFENPLGWSQRTYAHVIKAVLRNSDSAFIGRHNKLHFCSFHDTARFLFKKYMGYVNRYYLMTCTKFGDNWMRDEQAN